jgi:hypothetical protein
MRPIFLTLIALVALLTVGPVQATELVNPPSCGVDTAAAYSNLSNGCTLSLYGNTFTLKSFDFQSSNDLGYRFVDDLDVMVTPLVQDGQLRLAVSSSHFSVTSVAGPQRLLAKFEYVLDPPPPILEDLSMEMDAQSPVFPGFANIFTEVCANALFVGNYCDEQYYRSFYLNHLGYPSGDPRNILNGRVTFPLTYQIHVRTTITLDANGGSSQIDGFRYASQPVPEPATGVLVLAAAGVGSWLRKRRFTASVRGRAE